MAAPTDTTKQHTPDPGSESPTTVKPFEMSDDDDDVQETGVLSDSGAHQQPTTTTSATSAAATTAAPASASATAPKPATVEDEDAPPPTKPPRPETEAQKNEAMLKEAFPSIELSVIKAVLIASGGRIDPAFNALLAMSDPDAVQNDPVAAEGREVPPPQPPRPTGPQAQMSQVEADELYARQLAEHYDNVGAYENRTSNRGHPQQQPRRQQGLMPDEEYEREPNFIDDELPVIRENLRKGFVETQTKVNSWFTNLKKRIDGEYDSEEDESQPSRRQHQQYRRSGEGSRRSNDYDRYDADPQVLSDDFAGMRLNQDGSHGRSGNPNLYQPPPRSTQSKSPRPDSRKVSFQEGHESIDNVYDASPKLPPKDNAPSPGPGGNSSKPSKWQPMSTVEPDPITEHDPFSLGDSEDERDTKTPSKHGKTESKDIKMDDAERLKQATADAMADSLMDESAKKGGEEAKKA
ncbi:CUE domain-containingprotein [Apiospora rasikravindrae]|uniref:CUE domain-containingprotein n=1 Tax=Apiospora rasikravindrae TaxID=990691 RepID=A0ABR1T1C6_9PEZI